MKKLSRRERTILRWMIVVVLLAGFIKGFDKYVSIKESMRAEIDSLSSQVTAYLKELEGEDPAKYRVQGESIEEQLVQSRERVLELPQETDASLLIRQTIDEKAQETGLTINSISSRTSKAVQKDKPLRELRTYFGYDTDLESLLHFFNSMQEQDYYLVIESLNISARNRPRRNIRRRNTKTRQRLPLNGNVVLSTLFLPNAEASLRQYVKPVSSEAGESTEDTPLEHEDFPAENTEELLPELRTTLEPQAAGEPLDTSRQAKVIAQVDRLGSENKVNPAGTARKPLPKETEPPAKDPKKAGKPGDDAAKKETARRPPPQPATETGGRPVKLVPKDSTGARPATDKGKTPAKPRLEGKPRSLSGSARPAKKRQTNGNQQSSI